MKFLKKVARDAVDEIKQVSTKEVSEKTDIIGDLATIGIFILMSINAFRGGSSKGNGINLPDHADVTINNYYYGGRVK